MTAIDEIRLKEIFLGEDTHLLDTVEEIVRPETSNIVNVFYSELIGHPDVGIFLDSEIVAQRLTLVLCDWLKGLLRPRSAEDLGEYLAFQNTIGATHARINVPMHLIVDGMRVMRRELCALVVKAGMPPEEMSTTLLLINEILDHVMSLMNESYLGDLVQHERNIHSMKMQVSPYSLAMECEKQRSFLFNWANQVTLDLVENAIPNTGRLSTLLRTEFGLWVTHKTPLLFSDKELTGRLEQKLAQVDAAAAAAAKAREGGVDSNFFAAVHAFTEQVSGAAWTLSGAIEQILQLESGRDTLTRLFNRRFLPTVMRHETELSVKHELRFAIMLIDIDYFKKINDTHGHDAGDMVLQQFSETLATVIRANDYLFRYGGEEFLVIASDVTDETAMEFAEKLRAAVIAKDIDIDADKPLKITASFGIAIHDGHPDYQRTITRADEALYKAKQSGRNRCVLSDGELSN